MQNHFLLRPQPDCTRTARASTIPIAWLFNQLQRRRSVAGRYLASPHREISLGDMMTLLKRERYSLVEERSLPAPAVGKTIGDWPTGRVA
jgi:hypothetical protein